MNTLNHRVRSWQNESALKQVSRLKTRQWHSLCLMAGQTKASAMRRDFSPTRRFAGALIAIIALAGSVLVVRPLAAQSYRARMSREIADRLAHRVEASMEIIVSTADANVDALASR